MTITGTVGELDALMANFATLWGDPPRTPVEWPNRPLYWVDDDGVRHEGPEDGGPWVRVGADPADRERASLGSTDYLLRSPGLLVVEIFAPLGTGHKVAADLAAVVENGYAPAPAIPGFTFPDAPRARIVGEVDERWWKINVIVPYERDEVVT